MVKILIDSLSRRMGDTLLGLPFVSMFKYKFKGAHITYACAPQDVDLYRNINQIDSVVLQSIYNPDSRAYDPSYSYILRSSFDVDEKFRPDKIFGKLDEWTGWDACIKHYPIKIEEPKYKIDGMNTEKYNVGIFINTERPNMSMLPGTGAYPLEKWQEVIDGLYPYYNVYVFSSKMEPDGILGRLTNCDILGHLSAIEEISVIRQMDIVVGVSCGLMDMVAPICNTKLVILSSCDENGYGFWNGIPDKCVLPPNRFAYFMMENEDIRTFIKPNHKAATIPWTYESYFNNGEIITRNMRLLKDLSTEYVCDTVDCLLSGKKHPFETGGEFSACEYCLLAKDGKCAYSYKPKLKKSQYYLLGDLEDALYYGRSPAEKGGV